MKKQISSLIVLLSTFLVLVGCSSLKPQDIVHITDETSYHYWHNERMHERGIKFNIIMTGERLNVIDVENLIIQNQTLPVEVELIEPQDRDKKSTLIISATYKEKKKKTETEYKKLPNSLFEKEPFKNGVLNYSVKGKKAQMNIEEFVFKPKG